LSKYISNSIKWGIDPITMTSLFAESSMNSN
jgi:hypothetical protein